MRRHRHILIPDRMDSTDPMARLYAAIAEPHARAAWMPELTEVDAPPRPVEPGDRFLGRTRVFGHTFTGTSCIDVADGATHIAEEVVVGARFRSEWKLVALAGGTRVEHVIDLELPAGPLAAASGVILRWRLSRMQRKSLRSLVRAAQPPSLP